ncbi:unnamed protein product [Protopolystoma xenopodis]|uniref:Uncharacterized protein n=1 Tax=Protopolystoma xenopodis TaxID=117903 RepID=A0A448XE11_9PLAT|nr:unnamed protein product [Protopolystoma xenopodis]
MPFSCPISTLCSASLDFCNQQPLKAFSCCSRGIRRRLLVREAMEAMIEEHQWTPGNIFFALLQRFSWFDNWLKRRKSMSLRRHGINASLHSQ